MPYKNVKADRAYSQERRAWLKDHGICTDCGANYNEPGHVYCKACGQKRKHRNEAYYSKVSKAESMRALRSERIAQGLCGDCGKPNSDGYINCPSCRKKRREAALLARIRERIRREAQTGEV